MKKLKHQIMLAVLTLISYTPLLLQGAAMGPAPEYDFSETIQHTEFGDFPPSVTKLINKNVGQLRAQLTPHYFAYPHGFTQTRELIINEFLELALAAEALSLGSREDAYNRLLTHPRLNPPFDQPAPVVVPAAFAPVHVEQEVEQETAGHYLQHVREIPLEGRRLEITRGLGGLDKFFGLHPTLPQVTELILLVGVQTADDVAFVIEIKGKAMSNNLVTSVDEFGGLYGEIGPEWFRMSDDYFSQNSMMLLFNLMVFIDKEERSRGDFNQLRAYLANVDLHPDFAQNRPLTFTTLDRKAPDLAPKIRRQVIRQFRERLVALRHEVNPHVGDDTVIQFYLLEDMPPVVFDKHDNVDCPVCAEAFSVAQPGAFLCPLHGAAERTALHAADVYRTVAAQRAHFGTEGFVVKCMEDGRHEMILSRDILIRGAQDAAVQRDLALNLVDEWEIRTLRSYYAELLRLQRAAQGERAPLAVPSSKFCPTPGCNVLQFTDNQDHNGVVHCPNCELNHCYLCDLRAHTGQTCAQVRAAREAGERPDYLNPASQIRPCPYCGTPAGKDDACNSVICARCNMEWHFINGMPREHSFTHSFNVFGQPVPPRRYRVPGDAGYVAGAGAADDEQLSGFPAHDGVLRNTDKILHGAERFHE
ncbi:MAG: hypothetical protein HQK53_13385 [Oligoflexia bacterium]|nr:hypothetical protein [Oligoflexia bacterium]